MKTKILFLLIQQIMLISLYSCDSNSKIETPTVKSSEAQIENDLKTNFELGILSIYEDSKGNLWIGSKEEGICKFDGIEYTYYTTINGLPSNSIHKIQEDNKGNIWFKTGNGICKFDGKLFKTIPINKKWQSTRDPTTQTIESTGKWSLDDESIWFHINNNGLLQNRGDKIEYVAFPIPEDDISFKSDIEDKLYFCPYSAMKIYKDKSKKLWVGTFNRGVVEYDGASFQYHNPNDFGIGTIRSIFQDIEGNHWFGSNGGGLYKYDGINYINFTEKLGLTSSNPGYDDSGTLSRVWSIEQDNQGNMWFGTADSGLWKFDGKEMINYTMKDGLPSNFVEVIYKDKKGNLWFCSGSANAVLYTIKGRSFHVVNPLQSEK